MELLNALTPKQVSQFVGNRTQIKKLQDLVKAPGIIYLVGPNASGKTTLANLILANFHVFVLQKETLKELNQCLESFLKNRTIDSFFIKKPKAIVVDNLDILLTTEKGVLSALNGFASEFKKQRIVCIACCNTSQEKKLLELKNLEIVKLNYPQQNDTFAFLLQRIPDVDSEKLLKLTQKHRGCIRDIVMHLEMPCEPASVNFKDFTSFEVIAHIFKHGILVQDIQSIYKEDIGLVAFLLYENLGDELLAKKDIGRKKHALIAHLQTIVATFIDAAVLEHNIDSWDIINILRIASIARLVSQLANKKQPKDYKYKFCQTLSKISHKNIMSKKLRAIEAEYDLSQENLLVFADIVSTSSSANEQNFINAYKKYFG